MHPALRSSRRATQVQDLFCFPFAYKRRAQLTFLFPARVILNVPPLYSGPVGCMTM